MFIILFILLLPFLFLRRHLLKKRTIIDSDNIIKDVKMNLKLRFPLLIVILLLMIYFQVKSIVNDPIQVKNIFYLLISIIIDFSMFIFIVLGILDSTKTLKKYHSKDDDK